MAKKPYERNAIASNPSAINSFVEPLSCFTDSLQDSEERKKKMNRIAATKYREKKRKERESASDTLKRLEAHNIEIKSETISIQTEIDYLKKLIKEIENRSKA